MTNGEKFKEVFKTSDVDEGLLYAFVWLSKPDEVAEINIEWWNEEYKEPTTKNDLALISTWGLDEEIRCTMCTNSMKSDRGCDGSCVVNNDMYKAVMDAIEKRIQPTTKNDLGVDAISRKSVVEEMEKRHAEGDYITKGFINGLPSVTSQEPRWIPVSERLPTNEEYIANNGLFIVSDGNRTYAEYFDIYDAKYFGKPTLNVFSVDRCVTAWMPLPKAYREVEE